MTLTEKDNLRLLGALVVFSYMGVGGLITASLIGFWSGLLSIAGFILILISPLVIAVYVLKLWPNRHDTLVSKWFVYSGTLYVFFMAVLIIVRFLI